MIILKSTNELFAWRKLQTANKKIGLVPTMGALHDGHLSLVRKCLGECGASVVSVFLNPKQFGPDEDLSTYPIDIDDDLMKLESLNVDVVFLPPVEEVYGDEDNFLVSENNLSLFLEGESRPKFFQGVLTIVSKLFNVVQPHRAYFGKKDAQQLILIKKLVKHMKYPIKIIACDTVREHHGLAMSSRNAYLTKLERDRAKIIYMALVEAKNLLESGEKTSNYIKEKIKGVLLTEPGMKIDYISIADPDTLVEYKGVMGENLLISIAVFFCGVRLIDNIFYNQ